MNVVMLRPQEIDDCQGDHASSPAFETGMEIMALIEAVAALTQRAGTSRGRDLLIADIDTLNSGALQLMCLAKSIEARRDAEI